MQKIEKNRLDELNKANRLIISDLTAVCRFTYHELKIRNVKSGQHGLKTLVLMSGRRGGSWLVRSTPDRVVRVRGLAGDIVLYSWARHFTLTLLFSTRCINGYRRNAGGNPAHDHTIVRTERMCICEIYMAQKKKKKLCSWSPVLLSIL